MQHLNKFWTTIKAYFLNYLWLGVSMLLITIIIDAKFPEQDFTFKILVELFKNIAISIVIATIFSYSTSTFDFIDKIRTLLRDIIIDRNFLGNVDEKSKRAALNSLIKPSAQQKLIYSNIEDYYNVYINKTLDITKKNVRSDYNVNVCYDNATDKIFADHIINYRLYPTQEGYSNIKVGFKEPDHLSKCIHVKVFTPDGKVKQFDDLILKTVESNDGSNKLAEFDLKEIGKDAHHLKIEIRIEEWGQKDWMLLPFQALLPTDGFKYYLKCADNLEVSSSNTFGQGVKFYIDSKINEINISCTEWINEGTGTVVLIRKK